MPSAISTATSAAIEAIGEARGPPRRCPRADGAAERVGEALGHPSALRSGQGGAARGRAAAAPRRAGRSRPPARARPHRRCRGAGSPRSDARRCSPRPSAIPRSTAGPGLGLAVQAYGKRALPVLRWLQRAGRAQRASASPCASSRAPTGTARSSGRRSAGSPTIPCSRARSHTDVSYLACMRFCWRTSPRFFPQFATHNAQYDRLGARGGGRRAYEFQRLHGMGEALYEEVGRRAGSSMCRAASMRRSGAHEDLVAYLVRRLLENGANTSFVNRLADEDAPLDDIIRDPGRERGAGADGQVRGCRVPPDIFRPERANSMGLALTRAVGARAAAAQIARAAGGDVRGRAHRRRPQPRAAGAAELVLCPHDRAPAHRHGANGRPGRRSRRRSRAPAARRSDWDRLGGPARARSWSAPPISTSATACG